MEKFWISLLDLELKLQLLLGTEHARNRNSRAEQVENHEI